MAKKTSNKEHLRIAAIGDALCNGLVEYYNGPVMSEKVADKIGGILDKAACEIYEVLSVKGRASYHHHAIDEDTQKHIEQNVKNMSEAGDVRTLKVPRQNVKESGFTDTDKNSCA